MRVDVLETPDLGDRSYIVSDETSAIVIDPQRDIDRVEQLLAELGVPVTLVLETHIHNDYVTGGHALARRTGATYVVAGRDDVAFTRCAAHDGDEFTAGTMTVHVLETPGHTDTHLSYVVRDHSGQPPAVFSGGSLLYGSVGRTDLLGTDRTDDLTRKQWRSARRLAAALPDDAPLYPTHGFGSFCSSGDASGAGSSTIGAEKAHNDALTQDDEQSFVDRLVAGLTGYPAYYTHMAPLNAVGPDVPDLTPLESMDPEELASRIRTGEWVVDLRDRVAYSGRHLAGTVSMMMDTQFSTYVGWVIPWGSPITLIGESAPQVAEAQRQLVRIGIDHLAGATTGQLERLAPGVPLRSYETATFQDVAATPSALLLDVRRDDEVVHGRIPGSTHIPLHALVDRLHEVPHGKVWVHCETGFRAGIAASILDRAGHEVVCIDDDFANAAKAGLGPYWDSVYGTKPLDAMSWTQVTPATSLRLLSTALPELGAVLDVGAGGSTLVDALLHAGWPAVTVLDISSEALALVRHRLSGGPAPVSFVVADLLSWQPERRYDAWHDRAVFHFLVRPEQQDLYVATAARAVRPGGIVVIGTFAIDGPTHCSGLPTARYDAEALAASFSTDFLLEHAEREDHVTPTGTVQPFTWVVLRRKSSVPSSHEGTPP